MAKVKVAGKRKAVYTETYKKGAVCMDSAKLAELMKKAGVTVTAINSGQNNDGTEFATVFIDGIPNK